MSGKYDDILFLPHHVSSVYPPMSMHDRAAQFAPFSALTAHGAAIRETARETGAAIELDETEKCAINEALCLLQMRLAEHPSATVTYFVPDGKKAGGAYFSVREPVEKIDTQQSLLFLSRSGAIPFDRISRILL